MPTAETPAEPPTADLTPAPAPQSRFSWLWSFLVVAPFSPWPRNNSSQPPDEEWDAVNGVGDWRARLQKIYDEEERQAAKQDDESESESDDSEDETEQDGVLGSVPDVTDQSAVADVTEQMAAVAVNADQAAVAVNADLNPYLQKVFYLHNLFGAAFLDELRELMEGIPPDSASQNMRARRHFLRDAELAKRLFDHLPSDVVAKLNVSGCCSDLRFIHYPPGGYISAHTDGQRVDDETHASTHVSFLLYLKSVPEGEGGETTFLDRLPEECAESEPKELMSIRPLEGSILLFPHGTPHRGEAVGTWPKVLLRGDLY